MESQGPAIGLDGGCAGLKAKCLAGTNEHQTFFLMIVFAFSVFERFTSHIFKEYDVQIRQIDAGNDGFRFCLIQYRYHWVKRFLTSDGIELVNTF